MAEEQQAQRLEAGRAALERHAWQEAYELLKAVDQAGALPAEDLEPLAQAAWWAGHLEDSISLGQRAFTLHSSAGRPIDAARAAIWLVILHILKPSFSVAGGWLGTAQRLLEDQADSVQHGYLASLQVAAALNMGGDLDQAWALAERALELGRRFQHPELVAFALRDQAQLLARRGELDRAMALLDEAMVAAVSGQLTPFGTGTVFCSTISLCAQLGDYRRANEWVDEALRWCEREAITHYPGQCRIYRASLQGLRGEWSEAEEDLHRSIRELSPHGRLVVGQGFYEIAEIHRRKGDLEAAAGYFRQAEETGWDPQPGLSLLRLAQGKVEAAWSGIEAALEARSKDPLSRAGLLPARVEVALAAGQLTAARQAVAELETASKTFRTVAVEASWRQARGHLALVEGRSVEARRSLGQAWRMWSEAELPYDAARTRELLAAAHQVEGDVESARQELEGARAVYERLGAKLDLVRVTAGGPAAVAAEGRAVRRAFLFTDIVGSTQLLELIGDEGWRHLRRWHDETLRDCFARHGGQEVDHAGDGFFVAFEGAPPALECAIEIQRTLAEHRRSHGFSPQVRIGIHGTDATRRGREYLGKGVHQAARIAAQAGGTEILVSQQTLAGQDGYRTSEPRPLSLKGLSRPIEVVSLDWA